MNLSYVHVYRIFIVKVYTDWSMVLFSRVVGVCNGKFVSLRAVDNRVAGAVSWNLAVSWNSAAA
jgi:hypothetical protein